MMGRASASGLSGGYTYDSLPIFMVRLFD